LTKTDGNRRIDLVAKSNNNVKIVVINWPFCDLPRLFAHSKEFLYCDGFQQFTIGKYGLQMLPDVLFRCVIQVCKILLRQPDIVILEPNRHSRQSSRILEYRKLAVHTILLLQILPSVFDLTEDSHLLDGDLVMQPPESASP